MRCLLIHKEISQQKWQQKYGENYNKKLVKTLFFSSPSVVKNYRYKKGKIKLKKDNIMQSRFILS
jgi:hypothetical protein